jgi:polysaccharide export outer membrane protein
MNGIHLSRVLVGVTGFSLLAGTAVVAAPSPAGILHPGDQLSVTVYGEPTLTQTVVMLPDSTIQYPMVGRVSLANDTAAEASDVLRKSFARYLRQPIVSVSVVTEGQLTVMVLGNVKTPGKYTLPYNSHVTDAVAAAGGMGETNGAYPEVRLSDSSGVRDTSLEAILRKGDVSADLPVANNSVVYVPGPVTFNVEVVGAVDKPGEIQINEGDHLSVAIAKAGNGVNSNADLNAIRVTRQMPDGKMKVFNINLYDDLEKGDRSADIELQKNDVVYVPKSRQNGSSITNGIFGLLGRWI